MDIVIDANVLAHAANPNSEFFDSALAFVEAMLVCDVRAALDDTGQCAPVLDTSRMYMEYLECLPPGSISRVLLQTLTDSDRVDFHLRPSRELWTICKALVPRNNGDAIVLGVGVSCESGRVTSNDYRDFPSSVRHAARKRLGVDLLDSDELQDADWQVA